MLLKLKARVRAGVANRADAVGEQLSNGEVLELADRTDLGSVGATREGSNPSFPTWPNGECDPTLFLSLANTHHAILAAP
jgi:hypothetical protein